MQIRVEDNSNAQGKHIIIYYRDGVELTRENYNEHHPCYGWDFNNLTEEQIRFIEEKLGAQ